MTVDGDDLGRPRSKRMSEPEAHLVTHARGKDRRLRIPLNGLKIVRSHAGQIRSGKARVSEVLRLRPVINCAENLKWRARVVVVADHRVADHHRKVAKRAAV